jgi:bifunctional DNA-binding transcriptional regulator/antitoxin component of YhaV-PrlF toxin-antitoxin module
VILTLDSKRRLTVPAALAKTSPGDVFEAVYDEQEDEIILRRVKRKKESWLEVLKQCPVPMDDLPARSREYPKKLRL